MVLLNTSADQQSIAADFVGEVLSIARHLTTSRGVKLGCYLIR